MNIEPGSIFGKGAGERKRGRGFWWVRYFRDLLAATIFGRYFRRVDSLLSEVYGIIFTYKINQNKRALHEQ